MAVIPVDELKITQAFGPHVSTMTGERLSTSVEPDRLVKTHCCFCGQQCGIQLKVRNNEVIGFGPHVSTMTGERLSTSVEPDRLVKTHCCFCGQQCGIQLKVRNNEVIGFEPWEEFPFNRGMLCPKGVKRYLQGSHPDRLTTALARDPAAAGGFRELPYAEAIARAAERVRAIQEK